MTVFCNSLHRGKGAAYTYFAEEVNQSISVGYRDCLAILESETKGLKLSRKEDGGRGGMGVDGSMCSSRDGEGRAWEGTGRQLLSRGISVVHKEGTHAEHVVDRMRFGEVVTKVLVARSPEDAVVAKAYALTQPVVAHQNGLGAPLLDAIIGNALGTFIVGLEWCWTLWITQVVESVPQGFSLLPIDEECDVLRFSR